MTDEGAKALAIALEKLAAALAGGVHIHVYQQPPSTTQVQPPFPPGMPPYITTCGEDIGSWQPGIPPSGKR